MRAPYIGVAALCLIAVLPGHRLSLLTVWIAYALLALSLDFIWGYAGILCFGQVAFLGIGAYAYGVLAINFGAVTGNTLALMLAAAAISALVATALGYLMFYGRLGPIQVAISTYAFALVLGALAVSVQLQIGDARLSGHNGLTGIPPLTVGFPGVSVPFGEQATYATLILVSVLTFVALQAVLRSAFGRIVAAIKSNEPRAELLGFDVRRFYLIMFTVGGGLGGLAGALLAAWSGFISPNVFGLGAIVLPIIYVLVGGRATLVGAFVGAITVQAFVYFLGGPGGVDNISLILGAVLISIVFFLPQGVVGIARQASRYLNADKRITSLHPTSQEARAPGNAGSAHSGGSVDGSLPPVLTGNGDGPAPDLHANDLIKNFGGLAAVAGVDLHFDGVGMHCLIGPNGAGKSTLFKLFVGLHRPSEGTITYGGRDITGWTPSRRANARIGIKMQVASVFGDLAVLENLWVAAYARCRDKSEAGVEAKRVATLIGLLDHGKEDAGDLSHGQQQWLEIGMVLAQSPKVVLLDEPTVGMTKPEKAAAMSLLKNMAESALVIIVEHDMEFVRELDAPVTVLHEGDVFATGRVSDLRKDPRILDIYLGRRTSAADR